MSTLFGGVSVTLGGRGDGKKGGWEPFSGIGIRL